MNSHYNHRKYQPFAPVKLPDRQWPDQIISAAPIWCSVDLRDGNQALIEPMTVEQKMRMFDLLVEVGFKEIEVGFPSASQPDFDFVRALIEEQRIPHDVTIQVLVQAREHLIARTFEALQGARRAIVHVYNSTSKVQREQVFRLDKAGIRDIAVQGASWVKQYALQYPQTDWTFQYSPESFTSTEVDFAVEVCTAVIDVWQPSVAKPAIINLPATVEVSTPNVFADQVEWFIRHVHSREALRISVHTHNDRGCGVAAAELALMAGADRVEGTLLGNGERTGNMDVVTMGMNLYSQGVDPHLDFSNMDRIIRCVEECTAIAVHPRHAYAGELVYSAFSGSHQDAIRKCLNNHKAGDIWEVAYLPIDPRDLGRTYQEVIRINSQSGKGGISYVLEHEHGLQLPRWLQIEFSQVVQRLSEETQGELSGEAIWQLFQQHYLAADKYHQLTEYTITRKDNADHITACLQHPDGDIRLQGHGSGVINAVIAALQNTFRVDIEVSSYHEHALDAGAAANAVAYVQVVCDGEDYSGVAISDDIITASINAVMHALDTHLINAERKAA